MTSMLNFALGAALSCAMVMFAPRVADAAWHSHAPEEETDIGPAVVGLCVVTGVGIIMLAIPSPKPEFRVKRSELFDSGGNHKKTFEEALQQMNNYRGECVVRVTPPPSVWENPYMKPVSKIPVPKKKKTEFGTIVSADTANFTLATQVDTVVVPLNCVREVRDLKSEAKCGATTRLKGGIVMLTGAVAIFVAANSMSGTSATLEYLASACLAVGAVAGLAGKTPAEKEYERRHPPEVKVKPVAFYSGGHPALGVGATVTF